MNSSYELPKEVRKKAIEFAKEKTGIQRPHKSQTIIIESFEECYKILQELGLIKGDAHGQKESN